MAAPTPSPATAETPRPVLRSNLPAPGRFADLGDVLFRLLCQGAALVVVILAALLLLVLVMKAWLAIQTLGTRFFTTTTWDPEPSHREFGALAFIWGTLATSAIADRKSTR